MNVDTLFKAGKISFADLKCP